MFSNWTQALSRGVATVGSIFALALLGVTPAAAGVGGAAGPTWPPTLNVGNDISGYVDIVNASDGVNAAENVNILSIFFTPSCAAQSSGLCTTPDPGVFSIFQPIGAPGTSCANIFFTAVGPDASGRYQFVPAQPVHLGPADGSGVGDVPTNPPFCRIAISASVDKMPIDSTPPNLPATTFQFARVLLQGATSGSFGGASGQATVAIGTVSDLSITKTDGTGTYTPGNPISYTIVVSNAGPSDAVGASVADVVPAAITGVSVGCVASGTAACGTDGSSGNNISFTGVDIAAGAGNFLTLTVSGTVDPATTGNLVNTATVTAPAGTTDPNLANNSDTDTDTPALASNLTATKDDGVATYTPGQQVVYTIVVGNSGPSNALGAVVSDSKPAQVTTWTWVCSGATGGATGCDPAPSNAANFTDTVDLPVGGTITYTVTALIGAGATGNLVNTVTATPPAGGTPGTATDTDTPALVSNLTATKDDGVADVHAGTAGGVHDRGRQQRPVECARGGGERQQAGAGDDVDVGVQRGDGRGERL